MTHNTKIYLIFTILLQLKIPAYSKFGTDNPLTQSYIDLSKQKYFIDKSLLIQDIFEKYYYCYLYITAPKGFGKTTLANMIHFFTQAELNGTNQWKHFKHTVPYKFFKNRKISRSKKVLEKYLSRYSVLRLDLKIHTPIQETTEEILLRRIKTRIEKCYRDYQWILPIIKRKKVTYFGHQHSNLMITYIEKAMSGRLFADEAINGLNILSRLLNLHFRKPVVVIIDNYDYLIERFVRKGNLVRRIYDYIDRLIFETFEIGEENVYLGFIFGSSGLAFGKTNEPEIPDYLVIDEYSGGEKRVRMHRMAFLDDHVFTPYLGYSDDDLMVLNRKYNSNETEKTVIKRKFDGYMATTRSFFYNMFLVTKYFTDKMTSNLSSTLMDNCRPQYDKFRFIDRFIKKDTIREKILNLIIYDTLELSIEKMYKEQIYLHGFFDPNSKTSSFNQSNQIFTYLFEQGYLTHGLEPDHISIPNLEIKEYFLDRLQFNYEGMQIDVKKCSRVMERIFSYQGDKSSSLEKELEEVLQEEFAKMIESSSIPKILEFQAIAYTAAFQTKYRTNGEIVIESSNSESKAQILLLNLRNNQAMIVEVKRGIWGDKDGKIPEYNLMNITRIKYLSINVHRSGVMVNLRQ